MAEQELNAAQIGARINQMGSEGVPQHMRAERLPDTQLLAQLLTDNTRWCSLQLLSCAPAGKEPVLGLAPSPVVAQNLQQLRRQHHLARELALANVDDHPLAVDVGDLTIERLLTAETCTVVQGQQRLDA